MTRLILVGPPGSGKGTQGERLASAANVPHLATGDLLREIVSSGSAEGERYKAIMKSGNLIADEDIVKLVDERLKREDAKRGYLLDGFPRSLKQAELFDQTEAGKLLGSVLVLNVDEDALVERLSGRLTCLSCGASFHVKNMPPKREGICDNCGAELVRRADDNPESIKQRLKVYRETTQPVVDYYKPKGVVIEIDASGAPEKVFEALKSHIQGL